ncbi:cation:proton antiporter [Iocasia frigidifontis]|uniref:Cation:proton antiporter n=1 Tax=Iocasia fonsfrigidae TaxID=2682810 RepID=A0A8A7KEK5_9FIRM|nr:cation:proton antiporter [Iocasia fonsfrigidae]QTL98098.1 cation:proton antiporter [Iocasia fonsfrigidae]
MGSLKSVEDLQGLQDWFVLNGVSDIDLYIIALLIFLAMLIVLLVKKMHIPIVVGYVFLGMLLSVSVVNCLPFLSAEVKRWYAFSVETFDYIPDLALAFIAFTIGSELSIKILKNLGKKIILIVFFESIGAFLLVFLALLAIGQPFYLAIILGAIASATAPAATVMVLKEYNAQGSLTSTLLAVVGIDDALALTLFSFAEPISLIKISGTGSLSLSNAFFIPLCEVLVSVLLGGIIGFISIKLIVKYEDKTKKILILAATVIGTSAISVIWGISPLISNMAVGFSYRNFVDKNPGIAEYLEVFTIPLYAMFFILAGTKIRIMAVSSIGFLIMALVYTLARMIGKVGGASLGAYLADAEPKIKKYIGMGLLSQVGVAVALAYTVQKDYAAFPKIGLMVFNILLFTTALTEVIGPLMTKYAVIHSGEASN